MITAGSDRADASELLDLAAALDRDDERKKNKERPIYAIDSNVAIFLSQPSARASSEQQGGVRRVGFGSVLEGEPDELTDIVAHALAEHLYVHLRRWSPLLLIPPVAGEVHRYALRLSKDHVIPTEREMRRWRTSGAALLTKLDRTGSFGEEAEHLISQMQELLFLRYGPAAALRRLRRVFAERSILNSDIAMQSADEDLDEALGSATAAKNSLALTVRANNLMDNGLDRGLRDNFSDAYVMARLEQANQILEQRASRHRIIYLTADRTLLNVVGDQNPHLPLRHPRSWLTRLAIFQFDEESARQPLLDLLTFKAQTADHIGEDIRATIQAEWHDYLSRATESFVPLAETRDLFFDQAKDMLERYSSNIERFHDEIADLQDQAYENCFEAASETAAGEAQRLASYYARTVPPLVFEQWPVTQQTIETFLSWHVAHDFDLEAFRNGLRAIDVEDPSHYARYLALGTIFAGRGQWEQAASLAARANSLAVMDGNKPGDANGREGAFFEAVARRHLARSESDLDDALILLTRACEISAREEEMHKQAAHPDEIFDIVPERFEAERLASQTSRFYFRRYGQDRSVVRDDRECAAQLILDFGDLLGRLKGRLDTIPPEYSAAAVHALRQLIARTVTNVLGLALISRTSNAVVDLAWAEAAQIGLTDQKRDDLSSIAAITVLAFKRLTSRGRNSRDADRLRRHLSEYRHYYVFPYDGARFAEIDRLISAG